MSLTGLSAVIAIAAMTLVLTSGAAWTQTITKEEA